jgi:predicted CXXCH cytochrome family protein
MLLKMSMNKGELCLSCHDEVKSAESDASEHEPFTSRNCKLCHASHASDYENLLQEKSGILCLKCHSQSKPSVQHEPVEQLNCVVCHHAHGSNEAKHLKHKQPNLCIICHEETTEFWQKGVAHQPAQEDCTNCHLAHGSMNFAMLSVSKEALCADCHDIEASGFTAIHKGIKPSAGSCLSCHDPHGGNDKNLLYPVVHLPFKQGNCKPCHTGGAK